MNIAIVDYQMSNLFSVKHACEKVNISAEITSDPMKILRADGLILPGVGAFKDAMTNLNKLKLIKPIKEFIKSKRKFMGVCLGMQLIFEYSEEFGINKGLDVIKGNVIGFEKNNTGRRKIKVPQIGWNKIYPPTKTTRWNKTALRDIKTEDYVYFVHSFYVRPKNKKHILSLTNYEGVEYCSSILRDNVFALQFHPEKSGEKGISIYKNYFERN